MQRCTSMFVHRVRVNLYCDYRRHYVKRDKLLYVVSSHTQTIDDLSSKTVPTERVPNTVIISH